MLGPVLSIPHVNENTVTRFLADELERKGVRADVFVSIKIPSGSGRFVRREPDIWCSGVMGNYVVEAKFRERDLVEAVGKIWNDYLRFSRVLNIKGGFAILYPDSLARASSPYDIRNLLPKSMFKVVAVFPPEDSRRNFTVFEGTLSKVADFLAEHILRPPEVVEPHIPYMIKALRDAAIALARAMASLSGKDLEELFGGKHIFESVLETSENGKVPTESLRLATAYLLINQVLFYHVLSKKRPELFPEIDPDSLWYPRDLNNYFRRVVEIDYRTVFAYDVASRIPVNYISMVKQIVNLVKALSPEKVGGDLLGTIFHDLIPYDVRKTVAAYYTNVLAAEMLAWLAIEKPEKKVADFAVGSGGLLVAAYRRKRYLWSLKYGRFTQEAHRQFVEKDLLGIDIMPFAANTAACHLALQSPKFFTDKVNIVVQDSTELKPGSVVKSIRGIKITPKGIVPLDTFMDKEFLRAYKKGEGIVNLAGSNSLKHEIRLGKYDVIIMNPPFTRHERLPPAYKEKLEERFKDYRKYFPKGMGRLGLHGYFILLADRFLPNGGRMALVLPASVLRISSFEGIRKIWAEKYVVEYIITTWYRSAFSESTNLREMLFVAKKTGSPLPYAKTKIAHLKILPNTVAEARELADVIKQTQNNYEDERVKIKVINYSDLVDNTSNWFRVVFKALFGDVGVLLESLEDQLIPVKEIIEKYSGIVIRGAETARGGKIQDLTITRPKRALKKEDIWIIVKEHNRSIEVKNRITGDLVMIPRSSLIPALRRLSTVDVIDVTGDLDYIIVSPFPNDTNYFDKVPPPAGPLARPKNWAEWKKYVEGRLTNLALFRRGDISAPGTKILAYYSEKQYVPPGIAWAIKFPEKYKDLVKLLALWFNSTLFLLQLLINRKETRGAFIQLDKYVLEEMMVPDPERIDPGIKKYLLYVFMQYAKMPLPSLLEQLKMKHPVRVAIDLAWLKTYGVENPEHILSNLYETVTKEIEALKRLMAEGRTRVNRE